MPENWKLKEYTGRRKIFSAADGGGMATNLVISIALIVLILFLTHFSGYAALGGLGFVLSFLGFIPKQNEFCGHLPYRGLTARFKTTRPVPAKILTIKSVYELPKTVTTSQTNEANIYTLSVGNELAVMYRLDFETEPTAEAMVQLNQIIVQLKNLNLKYPVDVDFCWFQTQQQDYSSAIENCNRILNTSTNKTQLILAGYRKYSFEHNFVNYNLPFERDRNNPNPQRIQLSNKYAIISVKFNSYDDYTEHKEQLEQILNHPELNGTATPLTTFDKNQLIGRYFGGFEAPITDVAETLLTDKGSNQITAKIETLNDVDTGSGLTVNLSAIKVYRNFIRLIHNNGSVLNIAVISLKKFPNSMPSGWLNCFQSTEVAMAKGNLRYGTAKARAKNQKKTKNKINRELTSDITNGGTSLFGVVKTNAEVEVALDQQLSKENDDMITLDATPLLMFQTVGGDSSDVDLLFQKMNRGINRGTAVTKADRRDINYLNYDQFEAYQSMFPSTKLLLPPNANIETNFTSYFLASGTSFPAVPEAVTDFIMDGMLTEDNETKFVGSDIRKYTSHNAIVFGKTGSGKTVALQKLMLEYFSMSSRPPKFIFIDPNNEFGSVTTNFGGMTINVGGNRSSLLFVSDDELKQLEPNFDNSAAVTNELLKLKMNQRPIIEHRQIDDGTGKDYGRILQDKITTNQIRQLLPVDLDRKLVEKIINTYEAIKKHSVKMFQINIFRMIDLVGTSSDGRVASLVEIYRSYREELFKILSQIFVNMTNLQTTVIQDSIKKMYDNNGIVLKSDPVDGEYIVSTESEDINSQLSADLIRQTRKGPIFDDFYRSFLEVKAFYSRPAVEPIYDNDGKQKIGSDGKPLFSNNPNALNDEEMYQIRQLDRELRKFTSAGTFGRFFNTDTAINFDDARVVNFNLEDVKDALSDKTPFGNTLIANERTVAISQVAAIYTIIHNQQIKNRIRNLNLPHDDGYFLIVFTDEAHNIYRHPLLKDQKLVVKKEGRKYSMIDIDATQDTTDMIDVKTGDGESLVANTEKIYLFASSLSSLATFDKLILHKQDGYGLELTAKELSGLQNGSGEDSTGSKVGHKLNKKVQAGRQVIMRNLNQRQRSLVTTSRIERLFIKTYDYNIPKTADEVLNSILYEKMLPRGDRDPDPTRSPEDAKLLHQLLDTTGDQAFLYDMAQEVTVRFADNLNRKSAKDLYLPDRSRSMTADDLLE